MRLSSADGEYEIPEEVIAGLCLRYPQANVRDQLALMALWLAKNAARRPKRVLRFVETWLKRASPKLKAVPITVGGWWQSEEGTLRQAQLLGMSARPGEEMYEFRKRVADALKRAA